MTFSFYLKQERAYAISWITLQERLKFILYVPMHYTSYKLELLKLSFVNFPAKYLLHEKKRVISIIMHKNSTAGDVLQAYIHALVMAHLVGKKSSVHLESQSWMDKHYKVFSLKVPG